MSYRYVTWKDLLLKRTKPQLKLIGKFSISAKKLINKICSRFKDAEYARRKYDIWSATLYTRYVDLIQFQFLISQERAGKQSMRLTEKSIMANVAW